MKIFLNVPQYILARCELLKNQNGRNLRAIGYISNLLAISDNWMTSVAQKGEIPKELQRSNAASRKFSDNWTHQRRFPAVKIQIIAQQGPHSLYTGTVVHINVGN